MEQVKKNGWLAAHIALGIALMALMIWAFGRGFDFTDEADSLLATAQPFAMTLRFSEYMFYTHWLYLWAGEGVFWFRVYGLVLLLATSLYLAWQMVRCLPTAHSAQTKLCFTLCILASSTVYYCKWYPSPNYYWMAHVGLTLVVGSLLHIARVRREGLFSAWHFVWLGFGLTVTGLGRVSTVVFAIVLAGVTVIILFRRETKLWLTGLLITGATGLILLLAHMLFVAEGIMGVVDVYWRMFSPERASERGSLTTQMAYVTQGFAFLGKKLWQGGFLVFGLPLLARWLWKSGKVKTYPVWLMGAVFLYYCRYFFRDYGDPTEIAATMLSMGLFSSLVFIALMPLERGKKISAAAWGGLLFLIALSMGFGSAMPLLWGASRSLVFFVVGVLMCVGMATVFRAHAAGQSDGETLGSTAQGLSFLVMLIAVGLNVSAIGFRTYRQAPLPEHTESVVLHGGHSLKLWPEAADFVRTLQSAAQEHGWPADMHQGQAGPQGARGMAPVVLDFGADNAGIAYILGAAAPGIGRIYGGYDNTDAFARIVTHGLTPEQKRGAWIVTSTDDVARVSPAMVQELFPDFPQGYTKVWAHNNVGLEQLDKVLTLWKPE